MFHLHSSQKTQTDVKWVSTMQLTWVLICFALSVKTISAEGMSCKESHERVQIFKIRQTAPFQVCAMFYVNEFVTPSSIFGVRARVNLLNFILKNCAFFDSWRPGTRLVTKSTEEYWHLDVFDAKSVDVLHTIISVSFFQNGATSHRLMATAPVQVNPASVQSHERFEQVNLLFY